MGMFNIGENSFIRDVFDDTPDEKSFKLPASETEATSKKLEVLRTYANGSVAMIQRAAPDLLEGMDAAIFERARKLLPPSVVNEQTNVNLMPDAQRLAQIDPQVLQDTMLAKVQALRVTTNQDTGVMSDEANLANNFRKATDLTNDLTISALKLDAKRNLALALKPVLQSFRNTYANDLKALAAEIPEAKKLTLEKAKLGEFRGLQPSEVQYIEKFQRLQVTDEQLNNIKNFL